MFDLFDDAKSESFIPDFDGDGDVDEIDAIIMDDILCADLEDEDEEDEMDEDDF